MIIIMQLLIGSLLDGCAYALKRSHKPVIGSADEWVRETLVYIHVHVYVWLVL